MTAVRNGTIAGIWRLALIGCLAAVTPAWGHEPAAEMSAAAGNFLATLDQAQREAALFDIDSDKRRAWHFVPDSFIVPGGKRYGLVLKQMNAQQRLLVQGLLATGLSHKGLRQTATVQALEQVLYDLENQNPIRDPELYYVSVFGTPSTSKTWSWRFEGHHVSLNFTLVDGKKFAVTPSFFGANPGKVPRGPLEGLRVLAAEEDLARRLVKSLSDQQSREAIIDSKAPADIITGQDRKADKNVFTPARGIAFQQLNADQKALALELINEYVSKYQSAIYEQVIQGTQLTDGTGVVFAWAGSTEVGEGHYYRIQTPTFLFEYDNTQNGANHAHAVWRHFDGDFGADLLARHYQTADHHHEGTGKSSSHQRGTVR